MEKLILEKHQIRKKFNRCKDFGEVIREIETQFERSGHVVCEVKLNNTFVDPRAEEELWLEPMERIETIEVTAQTKELLVIESFKSYLGFLDQISNAAEEAAEKIREGELKTAQMQLAEMFEACQLLTEVLGLLQSQVTQLNRFNIHREQWKAGEKQFLAVLKEFSIAFEKSDFQLIADILEFELTSSLDLWAGLFQKFLKDLESAG